MSDAPETIWAFHNGPMVGYFVGKDPGRGSNVAKYCRDDLPATNAMDDPRVQALVEALRDMLQHSGAYHPSGVKAVKALAALENPDG